MPELFDYVVNLDMRIWGIDRVLTGQVSGPAKDLLEVTVLEIFTGLRPLEAAGESPAKIRKRLDQKTAPLRSHMAKYGLNKRIQLWVRNVVLGEQVLRIAQDMHVPKRWVERQISDASNILRAKRATGRPPKAGVLRQWKLMSN